MCQTFMMSHHTSLGLGGAGWQSFSTPRRAHPVRLGHATMASGMEKPTKFSLFQKNILW